MVQKKTFHKQIAALVVCLFCICFSLLRSQTVQLAEYKIKAVFLFNFTQFVEWPEDAFSHYNDPLVIGILGKNPFGNYINEAVAGEKMGNHPLTIVRYNNVDEITNCQMLFINLNDANLTDILSSLNNRSILTVSDSPNFIQSGGMIEFVTMNNKIKLQINPGKAKAAGLNISSKLLSVADILR